MADYVEITDAQVDPDAPLTSQLAYQWRDNWIAGFEGADGAPRKRERVRKFTELATGSPFITGWQGVVVEGYFGIASGIQIQFSNDAGATWPGSYTVSATGGWKIFIDFATGDYEAACLTAAASASGTIGSMPTNPTHIRINPVSGSDTADVLVTCNGGKSTT